MPAITGSIGGSAGSARGISTIGAGNAATGASELCPAEATAAKSGFDAGSVRNPHHTLSAPTRNAAADGTTQRTMAGRQRRSTADSRTGNDLGASASSSSLRNCDIGDRPAAETASSNASMSLPDGGGTGFDARRGGTSMAVTTGASPAEVDPSSAGNSVNASASQKSLLSATGRAAVEAISSPVGPSRRCAENPRECGSLALIGAWQSLHFDARGCLLSKQQAC
jgi:hypothetical protein